MTSINTQFSTLMKMHWQNQLKFSILVLFIFLYTIRYNVILVQCPFKTNTAYLSLEDCQSITIHTPLSQSRISPILQYRKHFKFMYYNFLHDTYMHSIRLRIISAKNYYSGLSFYISCLFTSGVIDKKFHVAISL